MRMPCRREAGSSMEVGREEESWREGGTEGGRGGRGGREGGFVSDEGTVT